MNEEILSLSEQQPDNENKLIHFWPPEPCRYCPRWTQIALLNVAFSPLFVPACAQHGLAAPYGLEPSPREVADEQYSVSRFIVWMFNEVGRVVLVSAVEPDTVQGYTLSTDPTHFEPLAWHCRYEQVDGERIDVSVIWDIDENEFLLYRDGQLVSDRREEVSA